MQRTALTRLQVIGIRYRRTTPDVDDERGLDAYATSGVYSAAGVPYEVTEPTFVDNGDDGDRVGALGRFNGVIANCVADARQAGTGILMTGGDCTHATGIVGGLQRAGRAGSRLGLVWFDAHGDFNTEHTSVSGSLGGMPLAVCAGLAHSGWRTAAQIASPLPSDRILLVGARNLDQAEAALIRSAGIPRAASAPGLPGVKLSDAVSSLASRCDALYLHIDADILDPQFVPSHGMKEPDGPTVEQLCTAINTVMSTGKVVALALVSIYNRGELGRTSSDSGIRLLRYGLQSWARHGTAA